MHQQRHLVSRRDVLKAAAAGALAASLPGTRAFGKSPAAKTPGISLQLYSVRGDCGKDFDKALAEVADRLEKSDQRQHEFNLVQARAIVQMGSLVKAMSERLGVIESQPARQPKSRGVRTTPSAYMRSATSKRRARSISGSCFLK